MKHSARLCSIFVFEDIAIKLFVAFPLSMQKISLIFSILKSWEPFKLVEATFAIIGQCSDFFKMDRKALAKFANFFLGRYVP